MTTARARAGTVRCMKRDDLLFSHADTRRHFRQIRTEFTAVAHINVDELSFRNRAVVDMERQFVKVCSELLTIGS